LVVAFSPVSGVTLTKAAAVSWPVLACVAHSGPLEARPSYRYAVALDVGLTNDATAAVVAHAERRGDKTAVVVDRCKKWRGRRDWPVSLDAVEAWVEAACLEYRAPLLFDPYQAQHLAATPGPVGARRRAAVQPDRKRPPCRHPLPAA
jgi:hypothetical protein